MTEGSPEGSTEGSTDRPLRALFVNGTLKPSPARSHTEGLMSVARAVLQSGGVEVETIRAVDHELAPGVHPDMTEHGAARVRPTSTPARAARRTTSPSAT